jgi:hypothetical protein
VVGRTNARLPRTYRLEEPAGRRRAPDPAIKAAYRRLAAAMLGVDVASLAADLRSARLRDRKLDLAA